MRHKSSHTKSSISGRSPKSRITSYKRKQRQKHWGSDPPEEGIEIEDPD